jgi:uncharacterized membrane protein
VKAVRIAVVASIGGALLAVPAKAQAAGLGGYTLTAQAAPIALQIFEPVIPIPAEPQLELNLSYSRAGLSSGPSGRALSSLAWPGDAVGYGLPQLLQNPAATYPVKVEATSPAGPKDGKQEPLPGTGMTAHAEGESVEAAAYLAKPAMPTLPTLPLPGVSLPSVLVSMEAFSSQSKTVVSGDKASATSYATAGSISLLGGLIKVDGLRTDAEAVSDGSRGTTTGVVSWTSVTLVGQTIAANQDGVKSPIGVTALPKLPAALTKKLADLGLSIDLPKLTKTAKGTGATVTGQGMTITLDTAVLRKKLGLKVLLDPLLALIPADLRTQLTPLLNITPKIVFILGTATSQATATPAFEAGPPPPASNTGGSTGGSSVSGGGSGTGVSGGSTGGTGGAVGDTPSGGGDTTTPVASAKQWPAFGGVPWYLFVLGFGLAALISLGLRRYVATMFGAGGCDLGASHGIPDLRGR